MKKCTVCKTLFDNSQFDKNKLKKSGLQSWCKSCRKLGNQKYYQATKEKFKEIRAKRVRDTRALLKARIESILSSTVCADCGFQDSRAFEFHHLDRSSKLDEVSKMASQQAPWRRIEEEIAKCIILCANCHRIRTRLEWKGSID